MVIEERKDGILERSLVAGITAFDFLISHALTLFSLLCLQTLLVTTVPIIVLDRKTSDGNYIFLTTNKDAPNSKLIRIDLAHPEQVLNK